MDQEQEIIAKERRAIVVWGAASVVWLIGFFSWQSPSSYWPLILLGSYFVADAGSYIFHYIVDFYGDPNKEGVVKEFQKHHNNPPGIVKARLLNVVYPAARIVGPVKWVLALPLFLGWLPFDLALVLFTLGTLWVLTQIFHRWSHARHQGWIGWLQRLHLIVTPKAHAEHHKKPHLTQFAVISGWSNGLFDLMRMPVFVDWVLRRFGVKKRESVYSSLN